MRLAGVSHPLARLALSPTFRDVGRPLWAFLLLLACAAFASCLHGCVWRAVLILSGLIGVKKVVFFSFSFSFFSFFFFFLTLGKSYY